LSSLCEKPILYLDFLVGCAGVTFGHHGEGVEGIKRAGGGGGRQAKPGGAAQEVEAVDAPRAQFGGKFI